MDFQANIDETKQFTKSQEPILYVTNLPVELTKEGVIEIFNYYGEIDNLFYRPNTSWAFVTYKTYREAESAIRDLHDIAPLYLKVTFKIPKTNNDTIRENSHHQISTKVNEYLAQNSQYDNKIFTQKIESSNCTDVINKQEHQSPVQKYYENDDLVHTIYTKYSPENSSTLSKNSLWTRGAVTVTNDGKRHISYGRGCTSYKIPEPDPKIGTLIEEVYNKRENILYEHGQDSLKHMIGKCTYCTRLARTRCKKCDYFYCTRECQEKDWPRHENECHQIPVLIKDVTSLSISNSKEDVTRTSFLSTQRTLRRPKTRAETLLSKQAEVTINQHMDTINAKCSINDECQSNHEINNITQVNDDISKLITSKKDITEERKSISNIDALKIENDIAFNEKKCLSARSYTEVEIVSILANLNYCVFRIDQKENIMQMKRKLSDITMTTCKVKPVVDNIYVYKLSEECYRVKVISTNPTKVYFIDYHITKIANNDDFYKLDSTNVVSFGIQICLTKALQKQYKCLYVNDIIFVKNLGFKGETIVVNIENRMSIYDGNSITSATTLNNIDKSAPDSDQSGSILSTSDKTNNHNDIKKQKCLCLPSVMDFLSEGECGSFETYISLGNNSYGITLFPTKFVNEFRQILSDVPKYCNSVKLDKYKAEIGEIVCGERADNTWVRGWVISHQPLKLALLDEAIIESVKKVVPYPDSFLNICKFGVICEVITNKYKLQVKVHYTFKVLSCTDDIIIEIYTDESKQLETIKAVIKPWIPNIEQRDIKFTELKTESKVSIVHFRSLNEIYVSSMEPENVRSFNDIMQRVGIHAQSAPYLKEPPDVGEMVIAKYIDGNYYRAIVTNIKEEQVNIWYIDYGNITTIAWKNLQMLSNELKQKAPCVTKIALKNIPTDIPINKDVLHYFLDLIDKEVHLLYHLEDPSSIDNVSLILPNGESVNDQIKKLLTPSWEKDNEEDKTVYMLDDGSADNAWTKGTTIEVIVVSILNPGIEYIMCPLDEDLVKNVYEMLPLLMNDYCNKTNYYIPRQNELCFGLYRNNWYRACCLDPTVSENKCILFFLDYGNTEYVLHENIRAMTKDFLTLDFLCNTCTVVNLVPKDKHEHIPPNVLKRISELISVNERVSIKIVEISGKNKYIIELPQIRATLIKENLIS